MASIEEFSKLGLKMGKITEVADHPNADKLYLLKVDTGDKTIQLVAGLKKHYTPQSLEGRTIAVLTNLEPRVVRGVDSQGMLLAAQCGDEVSILTSDKEIEPGSVVR